MWKIKNKEAVSPVIGVILMVAITVVLAAVLYVWVSGFMVTTGAPVRISVSVAGSNDTANQTTWIVDSAPSDKIDRAGLSFKLIAADGTATSPTTSAGTLAYGDGSTTGYLNTGDTFTISAGADGYYVLRVLYKGDTLCTTGSTKY